MQAAPLTEPLSEPAVTASVLQKAHDDGCVNDRHLTDDRLR